MEEVIIVKYERTDSLLNKCLNDVDALFEKYKKTTLDKSIFIECVSDLVEFVLIDTKEDLRRLKRVAFETNEIPRTKSTLYKMRREFIEANKTKCDYDGLERSLYWSIMNRIGHDVDYKYDVNIIWCTVAQICMTLARYINMCQY